MKKSGNVLFWAVAAVSVIFLVAVVISIDVDQIFPLINSDSLFFHLLYQDLITEGNTIRGWDLNTTLNLIPNAIVYLVAYLISNNPFINTMIHGIIQYFLFFSVLFWFYKSFRPVIPLIWHIPGIILLHLIFFNAIYAKQYLVFSFFVHPYHFGAFILFLALSAATHNFMHHPTKRMGWIIFILTTLGVFSNLILIVMFVIPWIGASFIAWYKRHFPRSLFLKINGIMLGSALTGILLFVLIRNLGIVSFTRTKLFSWGNVISSYNIMIESYGEMILQSIFMMITAGIFILTFLFMLLWTIRYLISKPGLTDSEGFLFNNWMLVNLIFTITVFFAPIANGMVFEFYEVRYNFFILNMPFINMGIISYYFLQNHSYFSRFSGWMAVSLSAVFAAGVAVFIVVTPLSERFAAKKNYYPDVAKVLDELYQSYNLKSGIGDFWDAKLVYVFSKNRVKLRQVYHGTDLYALGSPRSWYYPQNPEDPQPIFNFILYRETVADMKTLHDIFGRENLTFIEREGFKVILVPEFTYTKNRKVVLIEQ